VIAFLREENRVLKARLGRRALFQLFGVARRRDPRPMHFRLPIAILGAKESGGRGGEFWSRGLPFPPPPKCLLESGRFQGIGEDG